MLSRSAAATAQRQVSHQQDAALNATPTPHDEESDGSLDKITHIMSGCSLLEEEKLRAGGYSMQQCSECIGNLLIL